VAPSPIADGVRALLEAGVPPLFAAGAPVEVGVLPPFAAGVPPPVEVGARLLFEAEVRPPLADVAHWCREDSLSKDCDERPLPLPEASGRTSNSLLIGSPGSTTK
jgi:hypothetical protein